MIKYNFGGGHLGFQDGRHAKRILLYSSQRDKIDIIYYIVSGCTYIFGVEEKDGSMHKLFCDGHFDIQDGRHVGSNLVTSGS